MQHLTRGMNDCSKLRTHSIRLKVFRNAGNIRQASEMKYYFIALLLLGREHNQKHWL